MVGGATGPILCGASESVEDVGTDIKNLTEPTMFLINLLYGHAWTGCGCYDFDGIPSKSRVCYERASQHGRSRAHSTATLYIARRHILVHVTKTCTLTPQSRTNVAAYVEVLLLCESAMSRELRSVGSVK